MKNEKLNFKKKILSNFGFGLITADKIFKKLGLNQRIKKLIINNNQLENYQIFEKKNLINKDLKIAIRLLFVRTKSTMSDSTP